MSQRSLPMVPAREVDLTIDGQKVRVREGATVLDACRALHIDVPTLCFARGLTPVNVCRLCVVEQEGARALVPSCSRKAEAGMVISTSSPRVQTSRRVVLELLASSVDLSASSELRALCERLGADPSRFAGATVEQPVKVDNELFVRDYARCVLCYRCVEACGLDAQGSFAIAIAGRGFDARVSTEHDVGLDQSACVFCGNCVGVCPTGALMPTREHELRRQGRYDESTQQQIDTVCPYCGVGCTLTLHVQDGEIFKATSPEESPVTGGHLCVKGRFGWGYVQGKR